MKAGYRMIHFYSIVNCIFKHLIWKIYFEFLYKSGIELNFRTHGLISL